MKKEGADADNKTDASGSEDKRQKQSPQSQRDFLAELAAEAYRNNRNDSFSCSKERICSETKNLSEHFSKNQRGKGNNARCKECVGANKGAAGENKQATSKLEGPGITGELYHQLRLHCMAFLGGHNKATQRNAFLFLYCNFMLCA